MVQEKSYLINEAAKEVHVESHVLRYWEEELSLPIKRNEQGHRIYTQEDIDKLIAIKKLKEQGLQLKAVKLFLDNQPRENPFAQKRLTKVIHLKPADNLHNREEHMIEVKEKKVTPAEKQQIAIKMQESAKIQEKQEDKAARMQYLFQKMIKEAVEENNEKLITELSDNIKNDMCKELDYQFRLFEERENVKDEERRRLEDEHCRKLDELLRLYSTPNSRKKDKPAKTRPEKITNIATRTSDTATAETKLSKIKQNFMSWRQHTT